MKRVTYSGHAMLSIFVDLPQLCIEYTVPFHLSHNGGQNFSNQYYRPRNIEILFQDFQKSHYLVRTRIAAMLNSTYIP